MAQAELAGRTNKRKKSELGITEQGKYSAKYALTDVLVCGCCGSHYRRTGKNVKGEVQHVWRCLGRIEHRCKEAVGMEEKKLHAAICRCLSDMMECREEVIKNTFYDVTFGYGAVANVFMGELENKSVQIEKRIIFIAKEQ